MRKVITLCGKEIKRLSNLILRLVYQNDLFSRSHQLVAK